MTTPKIPAMIPAGRGMQALQSNGIEEMKESIENSFMDVMKTVQGSTNSAGTGSSDQELPIPAKQPEQRKTEAGTPQSGTKKEDQKVQTERKDTDKTGTKNETDSVKEKKTVPDETKEKINDAAGKVKTAVEEQLQISEEELDAVMEILGLTRIDLLNPAVISQIAAEVTDSDPTAVITDEGLYSQVNEILTVQRDETANVMQDLDMTREEFIDTVNTVKEEEALPKESIQPEQEKTTESEFGKELAVKVEDSAREMVRTPAEANPEKKTGTDVTERKSVKEELPAKDQQVRTETFKENGNGEEGAKKETEEEDTEQSGTFRGTLEHGRRSTADLSDRQVQPASFTQNLTQAVEQTIQNTESTSAQQTSYVDAQRLLDQIDSQIKISFANREETAMQMELNPASLGRLNVQLISRNGEVTAQFQAQNAQVRAALESHVSALRQSLEAQGIKITSVEVTVASHAFEQNLMQGQEQQQSGNARSGQRTRRLHADGDSDEISGIEGSTEETEADRITRSMMRANGGSVDFTA